MPPEIWSYDKIKIKTFKPGDIWSLGIIIYKLFTLQHPFKKTKKNEMNVEKLL